jgi:hypothetical protein
LYEDVVLAVLSSLSKREKTVLKVKDENGPDSEWIVYPTHNKVNLSAITCQTKVM